AASLEAVGRRRWIRWLGRRRKDDHMVPWQHVPPAAARGSDEVRRAAEERGGGRREEERNRGEREGEGEGQGKGETTRSEVARNRHIAFHATLRSTGLVRASQRTRCDDEARHGGQGRNSRERRRRRDGQPHYGDRAGGTRAGSGCRAGVRRSGQDDRTRLHRFTRTSPLLRVRDLSRNEVGVRREPGLRG